MFRKRSNNPPTGIADRGQMPRRCERLGLPLWGILIAGLLIRVVLAVATPAWDAPDEYAHYWYIEQIAQNGSLPEGIPVEPAYEAFQSPLYYLVAAPLVALGGRQDTPSPDKIPPSGSLLLLRFLSVLFGVLTIIISYCLFGLLPGVNTDVRLWSTALVAFLPTYVGVTSSVNNDALVVLLSACCLLVVLNKKWSASRAFAGGLLGGLALLTKINAVVLLPVILFLAFNRTAADKSSPWHGIGPVLLGWLIGATILVTRNIIIYGDWLAINPGLESGWGLTVGNILRAIRNLGWSFWLAFGRTYHTVPGPIVYLLTALPLILISLWGWSRIHRQHRRLLLLIMLAVIPSIFGSLWYTLSYSPGTMTSWGKNLFPTLPLLAVFFVVGWRAALPRISWLIPAGGTLVMIAGCLWALGRMLSISG